MAIRISPSYQAVAQQRYCCIPACIQMILSRRGLAVFRQEEIGIDLGLVVPPKEARFNNVPTGEEPLAGWGTRIHQEEYGLNNLFKKRKLSLTSTYYHIDNIVNIPKFISRSLTQGKDLLVCFRYGVLYHKNIPYGHGSLIEEIEGNRLTLVDPRADPDRKKVSIEDLVRSIQEHYKDGTQLGGIWRIEPT